MSAAPRFHPAALAEYKLAIGFYASEATEKIAGQFIAEVEFASRAIANSPQLWRKVDEVGTRRYLLHRFPYALYYRCGDANQRAIIYAVMHLGRQPGYWHGRLEP